MLEIPPSFGRDFRRGARPEVLAQVDGAMTFRGDTVAQYVAGRARDRRCRIPRPACRRRRRRRTRADIEERYMYNPTFESVYSIVPSVPALLLLLIPAILMTVSIVREKELGSMINFYVTPTGRLEYLLGKQLPVRRHRHDQLLHPDRAGADRLRRPDQGQLPDADAVHAALRHGDDRHRHGDLDVHRAARSRPCSSRRS